MKVMEPDVYGAFRCVGGKCPDTCCAAWEVVVDSRSAARYAVEPGPFGERLRAAMTRDGEDTVFRLEDGRCPFLNRENLCDIYLTLGEGALCRTCTLYPRFFHVYGGITERGLSLSCPEAARLLLNGHRPPAFVTREEPGLPEPNELNPVLYLALRRCREQIFAFLQNDLPLREKAGRLLAAGEAIQRKINGRRYKSIEAACGEALQKEGVRLSAAQWLPLWQGLEFLGPELPRRLALLVAGENFPEVSGPAEVLCEQALVYFVYRYFLEGAWDRQVLPRVRLVLRLLGLCAALCGEETDGNTLRRYISLCCKEVEHNEENLQRMMSK